MCEVELTIINITHYSTVTSRQIPAVMIRMIPNLTFTGCSDKAFPLPKIVMSTTFINRASCYHNYFETKISTLAVDKVFVSKIVSELKE